MKCKYKLLEYVKFSVCFKYNALCSTLYNIELFCLKALQILHFESDFLVIFS